MSGPTRGSVAGKGIQTQAQTKEFDEGFDRIFGKDRSKERGRFVFRDGKMVNVDEDWTDAPRRAPTVTEGLVYGNLGKSTDGVPIDSRTKHREYMKTNGLALAGDYSDSYREKEKASRVRADTKDRRETVSRAYYTKFKP